MQNTDGLAASVLEPCEGGALGGERRLEAPPHELRFGARLVVAVVEKAESEAPAVGAEALGEGCRGARSDQGVVLGLEGFGQATQVAAG